jgi:hypothetical protein
MSQTDTEINQRSAKDQPEIFRVVDDNDNIVEMECNEELPEFIEIVEEYSEIPMVLTEENILHMIMELMTQNKISHNIGVRNRNARLAQAFLQMYKYFDVPEMCKMSKYIMPILDSKRIFVDNGIEGVNEDYEVTTMKEAFKSVLALPYTDPVKGNNPNWTQCEDGFGYLNHTHTFIKVFVPRDTQLNAIGIMYKIPQVKKEVPLKLDLERYVSDVKALSHGDTAIAVTAQGRRFHGTVVEKTNRDVRIQVGTSTTIDINYEHILESEWYVYPKDTHVTSMYYRLKAREFPILIYFSTFDVADVARFVSLKPSDLFNKKNMLNVQDWRMYASEYGVDLDLVKTEFVNFESGYTPVAAPKPRRPRIDSHSQRNPMVYKEPFEAAFADLNMHLTSTDALGKTFQVFEYPDKGLVALLLLSKYSIEQPRQMGTPKFLTNKKTAVYIEHAARQKMLWKQTHDQVAAVQADKDSISNTINHHLSNVLTNSQSASGHTMQMTYKIRKSNKVYIGNEEETNLMTGVSFEDSLAHSSTTNNDLEIKADVQEVDEIVKQFFKKQDTIRIQRGVLQEMYTIFQSHYTLIKNEYKNPKQKMESDQKARSKEFMVRIGARFYALYMILVQVYIGYLAEINPNLDIQQLEAGIPRALRDLVAKEIKTLTDSNTDYKRAIEMCKENFKSGLKTHTIIWNSFRPVLNMLAITGSKTIDLEKRNIVQLARMTKVLRSTNIPAIEIRTKNMLLDKPILLPSTHKTDVMHIKSIVSPKVNNKMCDMLHIAELGSKSTGDMFNKLGTIIEDFFSDLRTENGLEDLGFVRFLLTVSDDEMTSEDEKMTTRRNVLNNFVKGPFLAMVKDAGFSVGVSCCLLQLGYQVQQMTAKELEENTKWIIVVYAGIMMFGIQVHKNKSQFVRNFFTSLSEYIRLNDYNLHEIQEHVEKLREDEKQRRRERVQKSENTQITRMLLDLGIEQW